jgi:hypothetical protein
MAARNLFARAHLPAFRRWLAERGWVEQPTKGPYEVARWAHPTEKPLVLHARKTSTVHLTVPHPEYPIVQQFIRDHHAKKAQT